MSRPSFIINCRQKGPYVYRSVAGALAQVVPCEIVVADFASTDNSRDEIQRAIDTAPRGAEHEVRFLKSDRPTQTNMAEMNKNVDWLWRQTSPECEWIFQASADDYSLPARISVCMEAVKRFPCSAIATTQYFESPENTRRDTASGYPRETGYVKAGDGLVNLAYGSTIGGYRRDFLERVASRTGPNTPDVYWGWLAALDAGFYAIVNPQHVHVQHANIENTGFQGKMLAAKGDEALRVAELNHFQLARLYMHCFGSAQELYPGKMTQEDMNAIINVILGQMAGWLGTREALHKAGVTPGVL